MMRLSSMNDTSGLTQPVVNNIQYNAASQLTAISYYSVSEARTYNNLLQLTNITAGSALNVIYNYTPGGNSGKITSTYDAVSGEAVSLPIRRAEPAALGSGHRLGADPGL